MCGEGIPGDGEVWPLGPGCQVPTSRKNCLPRGKWLSFWEESQDWWKRMGHLAGGYVGGQGVSRRLPPTWYPQPKASLSSYLGTHMRGDGLHSSVSSHTFIQH